MTLSPLLLNTARLAPSAGINAAHLPAADIRRNAPKAPAVLLGMSLGSVVGEDKSATPPTPEKFSTLLAKAQDQTDALVQQRAQAEDAAAGLVSNALILPILKQLRRSTFDENPVFSGGNGEKTFGPQFDIQLADRIAHSPRLGVKEVLADRLMKKAPQQVGSVKSAGIDVHG